MSSGCVVVPLLVPEARAARSAFTTEGSVNQVYVTGLSGGASMPPINSKGGIIATRSADRRRYSIRP